MSNPFDPSQRKNTLAGLLSSQPPSNPLAQPSPSVSSLLGSLAPSPLLPNGSAVSDLFGLGLLSVAEILANPLIVYSSYEINSIKLLFAGGQAWTLDAARNFVNLAVSHIR
jgi:hypothetical protein